MANKSLMLLAYVKHLPHGRDPNELYIVARCSILAISASLLYIIDWGWLFSPHCISISSSFKFVVEAFIQSYYEIMRAKLSKIKHCANVGKMAMLVTNGRNCHWSPIFQGNPQMCTICNRLIQKGR